MAIKVYNTLTRRKEDFIPVTPGRVGIYLCGPTVYQKSHIGHAVGPVIFDAIRRWLEEVHKLEVTLVLNVTDVDDKIIVEASRQGREMHEIAEEVLDDYLGALKALNVKTPSVMPKATEHIGEIIAMVRKLIDGGFAYATGGDVYFDVSRKEDYGKLSRRTKEEQEAGSRELQGEEDKRHPWDFALWKAAKPGEPAWDSPWGKGRPGWHIECSAMSMKYLGETFDVHGGGLDLVFPHHENEIAQSESATGKPFAKYWMHNGLTRLETRKMSKSLGNIRTLSDLLGRYEGEVLRFFILSTHYRRPIDFSDVEIEKVGKGLRTFYRLFERCKTITGVDPYQADAQGPLEKPSQDASELLAAVDDLEQKLHQAMDDDFNTADAIACLYEMANAANRFVEERELTAESSSEDKAALISAVTTLIAQARILGLFEHPPAEGISDELAEGLIQLVIDVRTQAREEKLFALADTIRGRLADLGIQLRDSRDGTTWERVR